MIITYDPPKRLANLAKHGIDFDDIAEHFPFHAALIRPTRGGRVMAIAPVGNGTMAVVFVFLGSEAISLISARPASTKERRLYAQR